MPRSEQYDIFVMYEKIMCRGEEIRREMKKRLQCEGIYGGEAKPFFSSQIPAPVSMFFIQHNYNYCC
jgi:hypothetical protein